MDEGVVDNLFVEAKDLLNGKLDLKVGRQDFLNYFGEGFLIQDGTPGDGSRTYYFNAARATWKISKASSIDFAYMYDLNRDKMLLFDNQRTPRTTNVSEPPSPQCFDSRVVPSRASSRCCARILPGSGRVSSRS
jgi:hypothetical protein